MTGYLIISNDGYISAKEAGHAVESLIGDRQEGIDVSYPFGTTPVPSSRVLGELSPGFFDLSVVVAYVSDLKSIGEISNAVSTDHINVVLVATKATSKELDACTLDVLRPDPPSRQQYIPAWITARSLHYGYTLGRGAANALAELLGPDLSELDGELKTISELTGSMEIDVAAIERHVADRSGYAPWDLTDAIASGSPSEAVAVTHGLLKTVHPLVPASVFTTWVKNVSIAKIMDLHDGNAAVKVFEKVNHPYPAEKICQVASMLSTDCVIELALISLDLERHLKGGNISPTTLTDSHTYTIFSMARAAVEVRKQK